MSYGLSAADKLTPDLSVPVVPIIPVTVPVVVVMVVPVAVPVAVSVIIAEAPLAVLSSFFHFMSIVFRLTAIRAVAVDIALKFPFQILDVLVAAFPVISADVRGIAKEHESARQCGNKARFHQHLRPDHRAPPQVRLIAQGWPGLALTLD